MTEVSEDASVNAAGYISGNHIDYLFGILYEARRMKDEYTEAQRTIIDCPEFYDMDRLNMVLAMSRLSDKSLAEWEEKLLVLRRLSDGVNEELFDFQQVRIITMFLMLLESLKPRSLRHLENFLSALTDGEWVDGLIIGKGHDSEFRCIDKASEEVKKEFGL